MTKFIKPAHWNINPSLTQAPELWRDACFAMPLLDGAPYDIVGRQHASLSNSKINQGLSGTSRVSTSTGNGWQMRFADTSRLPYGASDRSFIIFHRPRALPTGASEHMMQYGDSVDGTQDVVLRYLGTTDNRMRCEMTTGGDALLAPASPIIGRECVTGFTFTGTNLGGARGFSHGTFEQYANVGGTVNTVEDMPLGIGGVGAGSFKTIQDDIMFAIMWSRKLSDEEVLKITSDPYRMFRQSMPVVAFKPSASLTLSYLRPDADDTDGGWTDAAASNVDLFSGVGTTFVDGSQTLTGPQVASITDYTDLYLEFEADAP